MPIENIRQFSYHRCGFVTTDPARIKLIEQTGTCPACQNGKGVKYVKKNKPQILHMC